MGRNDLDKIGADEGQRDRDLERAEELRQRLGQGDLAFNSNNRLLSGSTLAVQHCFVAS